MQIIKVIIIIIKFIKCKLKPQWNTAACPWRWLKWKDSAKGQWGCGAPGALLFHWWGYKTTQPHVTQRPVQRCSQQLYSQWLITRKCLLTGEWISKMWYGQTGIPLSNEKEWTDTCSNCVNLKIILLGKKKKKIWVHCIVHLYEILENVN